MLVACATPGKGLLPSIWLRVLADTQLFRLILPIRSAPTSHQTRDMITRAGSGT
jgi:hypothetical protein